MKRNLLNLLGGILLCLFLIEVGFRLFAPQGMNYIYQYHKEGYIWNSGESGIYALFWGKGLKGKIVFNKSGEVDSVDHPIEKPENAFRVLFLGDSITMGWPFDEDKGYVKVFKKELQKLIGEGQKVETINCAVPGVGNMQKYKIYKERCSKYKGVDLVVWQNTLVEKPMRHSLFSEVWGGDWKEINLLSKYYGYFFPENKVVWDTYLNRIKKNKLGVFQLSSTSKEENSFINEFLSAKLFGYRFLHSIRFIENNHTKYIYEQKFDRVNQPFMFPNLHENQNSRIINRVLNDLQKEASPAKLLIITIPGFTGMKLAKTYREAYGLNAFSKDFFDHDESICLQSKNKTKENCEKKKEEIEKRLKNQPFTIKKEHKMRFQLYQTFIKKLEKKGILHMDYLSILEPYKLREVFLVEKDTHPNEKGYTIIGEALTHYVQKNILK